MSPRTRRREPHRENREVWSVAQRSLRTIVAVPLVAAFVGLGLTVVVIRAVADVTGRSIRSLWGGRDDVSP